MSQLGLVPTDGGEETWLTTGDYDIEEPDFSPDDLTIACVRWVFPGSEIGTVDATTGEYTALTDSTVLRDNPDAVLDVTEETNMIVYERESSDEQEGLLSRRPKPKKKGTGIFLVRHRRSTDGAMAGQLGTTRLDRTAPNPAITELTIGWQIPRAMRVCLSIYDISGRLARTLVNGQTRAGRYLTDWNGKDNQGKQAAAGIYFVRLDSEDATVTEKVVLQK